MRETHDPIDNPASGIAGTTGWRRLAPRDSTGFVILLFFAALLLVGAAIHDDYGLTYDEDVQRSVGIMNAKYVTGESRELLDNHHRIYGPFFEIVLVAAERVAGIDAGDIRGIYRQRHFLTFLAFYVATIAFYLTGRELFASRRWALLGTVFLVLSPRIFAHAFYNSKDLAFLSLFTIAVYTLVKFSKEEGIRWAVIHAACTAWAIDTRVMGIVIPVMTMAVMGCLMLRPRPEWLKPRRSIVARTAVYLALAGVFTVAFWPFLWTDPVRHFMEAFREMRSYPWQGTVLYRGVYIEAGDLPWHYVPVWIAVTTPLIYIVGFMAGNLRGIWRVVGSVTGKSAERPGVEPHLPLLLFWGPLLAVIIAGARLYDGWRHMFYIYPSFILLSVVGYRFLAELPTRWLRGKFLRIGQIVGSAILVLGAATVGLFMIREHPHQNVYFNRLAGRDMAQVKSQYEMDYWGGTFKQGLEFIVRHDASPVIRFFADQPPGFVNRAMLPPQDRDRLEPVSNIEDADYFLTTFRWHAEPYPYSEYHSIRVGNAAVLTIYRPDADGSR